MGGYNPRADWTDAEPSVPWQGDDRRLGTAVHWPGYKFRDDTHADCLDHVARIEADHLAGEYGAIAYNLLACRHGFTIEGRGTAYRSGANGSTDANRRHGSVCALLPVGGTPTGPMLDALLDARARLAPSRPLRTHNQVRPEPTACPGPWLTRWVTSGRWREDADMPSAEDIARAVWLWQNDAEGEGIPNPNSPNADDNPYWHPRRTLAHLEATQDDHTKRLRRVEKRLDALPGKVREAVTAALRDGTVDVDVTVARDEPDGSG